MRFSALMLSVIALLLFFFFNDTATTEIYTLSLHDALPIFFELVGGQARAPGREAVRPENQRDQIEIVLVGQARRAVGRQDRKSTRLNSSHLVISYAVFCLKKKKNTRTPHIDPT